MTMANKRITDRGLLIYYTSYDEVKKIDSTQLGELIKKELAWMSGRSDEPEFEDVRCDIFHMHLKEQIVVRDIANMGHGGGKVEEHRSYTHDTAETPTEQKGYEAEIEEARQYYKEGRKDKAEYIANKIKNKFGKDYFELMEIISQ